MALACDIRVASDNAKEYNLLHSIESNYIFFVRRKNIFNKTFTLKISSKIIMAFIVFG